MTKINVHLYACLALLQYSNSYAQTSIFNSLLQKNVDKTGRVDYQIIKKQ